VFKGSSGGNDRCLIAVITKTGAGGIRPSSTSKISAEHRREPEMSTKCPPPGLRAGGTHMQRHHRAGKSPAPMTCSRQQGPSVDHNAVTETGVRSSGGVAPLSFNSAFLSRDDPSIHRGIGKHTESSIGDPAQSSGASGAMNKRVGMWSGQSIGQPSANLPVRAVNRAEKTTCAASPMPVPWRACVNARVSNSSRDFIMR